MRKIHLHGILAASFGAEFNLEVETAAEAVRALSVNFPDFAGMIRDGQWHVIRGDDLETGMALDAEDAAGLKLGRADLHIIPAVAGAKGGSGGLLKTVLGVALVGAAFAFSGGTLAAPLMSSGLLSGMTWGNVAMLGGALALTGVSTMLAPETSTKDLESSYLINGPTNNYIQGAPVPLAYGRVMASTVVVSGGIDVENIPVGVDV